DLTKIFGRHTAVNHVNMNIEKGEIYGFIGRNGAGKTTLMRMVLSLAFPSSGSIELFGEKDIKKVGNRIGSLIEAPGLYKNCTARENLERFSILYGSDRKKVPEILEFVGLAQTGSKPAGKFSLGMRQRLGIAIAMLNDPELMILDEPVNGLDPEGMKEVRSMIQKLNRERGITVLISSHLLEELSKLVTRYGIINNGQLLEEISADDLEKNCTHCLRVSVDDIEKSKSLLTQIVPEQDIQVADGKLRLMSHLEESGEINRLLVQNGVMVRSLEVQTDSLEDYFMKRIGG
ncbi:MAG: ATP-binding cassette domain-containing protein, partial [Eubacterium sp.]|nr:ATP-binding cassette domain-containing protein [Eubacterium sp.]